MSVYLGDKKVSIRGLTQQGIEPTGTIDINDNGIVNVKEYANANVNVPQGIFPQGTLDITENGEFNVTEFAKANVNVGGNVPSGIAVGSFTPASNTTTVTIPNPFGNKVSLISVAAERLEKSRVIENGLEVTYTGVRQYRINGVLNNSNITTATSSGEPEYWGDGLTNTQITTEYINLKSLKRFMVGVTYNYCIFNGEFL